MVALASVPLFQNSVYAVIGELPVFVSVRAVQDTMICVSLDDVMVGAAIVVGTLLVLAPTRFEAVALSPNSFVLETLTRTNVSKAY